MSKYLNNASVIIISSVKTRQELPLLYRLIGHIYLDRLVPASLFKIVTPLTYWAFGVKTIPYQQLLKDIIDNTDGHFLKWAIGQIVRWQNIVIPADILHIHGSKDKILLLPKKVDKVISNGGHLMVLTNWQEIEKAFYALSHK